MKNKYVVIGDMCFILLTKGKVAIIDKSDLELVKDIRWYCNSYGYARNTKRGLLHRFILGLSNPKIFCDHINHDGLDNRRCNLRSCTNTENLRNSKSQKGSSSFFKGVCWKNKKWHTQIMHNGKKIHLGYYKNEKQAARVYNHRARELFGEFACYNEIDGKIEFEKPVYAKHSSKYCGVGWHEHTKKWQARLRGKYLGLFKTEESAHESYLKEKLK